MPCSEYRTFIIVCVIVQHININRGLLSRISDLCVKYFSTKYAFGVLIPLYNEPYLAGFIFLYYKSPAKPGTPPSIPGKVALEKISSYDRLVQLIYTCENETKPCASGAFSWCVRHAYQL